MRNIPNFKDRAKWSHNTAQPMRRHAFASTSGNHALITSITRSSALHGTHSSHVRGINVLLHNEAFAMLPPSLTSRAGEAMTSAISPEYLNDFLQLIS